jgi:hypothetical protein
MSGRVIIQDVQTRLYLGKNCSWVESCQQAKLFEHAYSAILEGLDFQDRTVQVVWCFQNPQINMYMPARAGDEGRIVPCVTCPMMGLAELKEDRRALQASHG